VIFMFGHFGTDGHTTTASTALACRASNKMY